jgi:hypothetical protein
MEQLHDNGGAVGLYGVSHGGLQLHVPHQYKSTDSVLVTLPGSAVPSHPRLHRSTPTCTLPG